MAEQRQRLIGNRWTLVGPGPYGRVQFLAIATLGFWTWMLATGIILLRRTS